MKKILPVAIVIGLLLPFALVGTVSASPDWVSPTGYNDPNGGWHDETKAYDDSTSTYAYSSTPGDSWGVFLELTHSAIVCNKVRFYAHYYESYVIEIDLDVYYGGSWHHVYEGSYSDKAWEEKSLGGSFSVTTARVRFYNTYSTPIEAWLYEFDFGQVIAPTVTTQAVTNIGTTTATGHGTITNTGGENCDKRGVCWNTAGNPTVSDSKSEETGSFGIEAFSRSMTGLSPNTHYYVRAYAHNPAGYGYGSQVEFTTNIAVPTVTTNAASSVEETTATLNGQVTNIGGQKADLRGFNWGLTSSYGSDWTEGTSGTYQYGTGTFNHGLTGLSQGTLYHFRAKAHNSAGWGYGSDVTFLTKPEAPTGLDANAASSGTIHLTWNKGTGAQKTYIRGKAGSYPTSRSDGYLVYSGTGTSCDDTGLTGGTIYYYRAWSYATDGGKEQYSDAYSEDFALAIEKPSVTTNDASLVTGTSATLNAQITNTGGGSATSRGFVWDTTSRGDPGNTAPASSAYTNNWKEDGTYGVASFSHALSSLTKGETYYFRGCAYNPTGDWSYGTELSFSTPNLALWFQPNAMISGTALIDRAGTQNGIITWGSNPAGISVVTSGLQIEETYHFEDVEGATPDIFAPETAELISGVDLERLENNPMYPLVESIVDISDGKLTASLVWILGAWFITIAAYIAVFILMREHILFAGLVGEGLSILFYVMGIFDYWVLIVFAFGIIAGIVQERMPTW